jgi:hypothetical protein
LWYSLKVRVYLEERGERIKKGGARWKRRKGQGVRGKMPFFLP